jgi:hypothetical protein
LLSRLICLCLFGYTFLENLFFFDNRAMVKISLQISTTGGGAETVPEVAVFMAAKLMFDTDLSHEFAL